MKLSVEWLKEFVDISESSKDIAAALTMSGSKVETVEHLGADITNVVVGRVESVVRHPNADKLFICKVDVGRGEAAQIITGATNVTAGVFVPVALAVANLPCGKVIKAGKMRGEVSEGMLCSGEELCLTGADQPGADADGILLLEGSDYTPGEDIHGPLMLSDSVLDFEITPNRPDCLSVIGLAREAAATFGREARWHGPEVRAEGSKIEEHLSVEVPDSDLCPRYTARMVENVRIGPSPMWMRRRLRACGIRPINNIVDITNYVLLEYGQPMHAFDYACVQGGKIVVRRAAQGETIETLDGQTRNLTGDMLVIADAEKPVGIAGVMGGEGSGITAETRTIVFESANFSGPSIRKTALSLAMRTDASSRFEKGLDLTATVPAVQRACELVELLGAGTVCSGMIDVGQKELESNAIKLDCAQINGFLGTDISESRMQAYLRAVGCEVGIDNSVTPPSWRADISIWQDLAEEVARFYGYDNIPSSLTISKTQGRKTGRQYAEDAVKSALLSMGFDEMLTFSFVGRSDYVKCGLDGGQDFVSLLNPLGEETSVMRTTALPSLLGSLARNNSRRNQEAMLFEIAMTYQPRAGELPDERPKLVLGGHGGGLDFFALKGCVEKLLEVMRVNGVQYFSRTDHPSFHPGRCAEVRLGDNALGVFGEIHPEIQQRFDVDKKLYACELDFLSMLELSSPEAKYIPLPRYPSVSRDLALVCDESIPAAELIEAVKSSGGKLLRECAVFDVYTGSHIPTGKKSVAFSLLYRADDRTLTDEEVDASIKKVLKALHSRFEAVIRS